MRPTALLLLITSLLTGCANQGTVVRKEFRPLPAYLTYGFEGTYNFTLRTADGRLVSQMVTPGVFDRYAVGDHFNDLQPRPSSFSEEPKLMRQISGKEGAQHNRLASLRRGDKGVNKTQVSRAKTPQKRQLIVRRALQRRSSGSVATAKPALPSVKVAQVTRLPAPALAKPAVRQTRPVVVNKDYTIVQVIRCR